MSLPPIQFTWGYYQIHVLGNICTISIKGTANMLVCLHTVPHVSDVNYPVTFKLNIVIVSKLCVNMFGECSTRLLSFQTRMYLSAIESLSLGHTRYLWLYTYYYTMNVTFPGYFFKCL